MAETSGHDGGDYGVRSHPDRGEVALSDSDSAVRPSRPPVSSDTPSVSGLNRMIRVDSDGEVILPARYRGLSTRAMVGSAGAVLVLIAGVLAVVGRSGQDNQVELAVVATSSEPSQQPAAVQGEKKVEVEKTLKFIYKDKVFGDFEITLIGNQYSFKRLKSGRFPEHDGNYPPHPSGTISLSKSENDNNRAIDAIALAFEKKRSRVENTFTPNARGVKSAELALVSP